VHIGAPEEGFRCNSFHMVLHASTSLAANCCYLEYKIRGMGVHPDSVISAPRRAVGSTPKMDPACQLRSSWRSTRLTTSWGFHKSSLSYSATTWMQPTWTALTPSGTMPYVMVGVRSLASAALAFFMHRLCCFLNVRCGSIQMPSQHIACVLNSMNPLLTLIVAVSFGRRCFLWPSLCVNSAASILAVSNSSLCQLAHSMLIAAHPSSIETTWSTSLPVATQPRSSTKDSPSASDTYHSTHLMSSEVKITKRIGDTGEPCGSPASTGCLSMPLPSIIISSVLSMRTHSIHRIRSPSICLTFIKLTSLPFATLGKAALMSMRSTPVMWPFLQAG